MTVSTAKRTLAIFLLSPFALLLVAACGGQEQGGGDGEDAVNVGNFADWDVNKNNELSQQEFNQGVFENIDADTSGTITEEEFNAFSQNKPWFNNIDANFADWDVNKNNELSQQEFNQGAGKVELFGEWDADNNNVLVESEFREGLEKPRG